MSITQTKINYFLFTLLFVAIGFLLYQNEKLQMALRSGGPYQALAGLAPNASTSAALAGVTVGSLPLTDNIVGTVTALGSNTLKIKDAQTGAVDSVSVNSNTVIQRAGKLKDAITRQKELDAYNAQAALLLKDPVKNKVALAAMQLPPIQEITPGSFSDLVVGDQVLVTASSVDSNNMYQATIITKNSAQ